MGEGIEASNQKRLPPDLLPFAYQEIELASASFTLEPRPSFFFFEAELFLPFGTPKISLFFRSLLSCPSVSQAAFALTQILGGGGRGGARRAEGGGGRVGENLRTSTPFPPLFFTRSSTAKKCFCQIERGEREGAPSLL